MRSKNAKYSSLHQVYLLSDILSLHGVETAVLCPGSRNAPLIEGFNSNKKIQCLSIVDERSAAFFALGIAQKSAKPVAVITTSGTAVLNLAPAIAEAYYQGIPLIIITADRPPEWIDQEDNQAIRQRDIYRNYIKYSCELPIDVSVDSENWYAQRLINEAVIKSTEDKPGPAHINVPFREPLYAISGKRKSRGRKILQPHITGQIFENEIIKLREIWKECEKRLIIVGTLNEKEKRDIKKYLKVFLRFKQAVIIVESTSNINDGNFILGFDNFLLDDERINSFKPDLVVVLGRNFISKKLKQFIRDSHPKHVWASGVNDTLIDTFQKITVNIQAPPEMLLKKLISHQEYSFNNKYIDFWNQKYVQIQKLQSNYFLQASFSDFSVMNRVLRIIPQNSYLQLGNSMPVRYFEMLITDRKLNVYSNRGTSGIDGCVSTAAGAAWYKSDSLTTQITTLIVGDLSFFYDGNALWNNNITQYLKIILLNNGGGNIFDIIDGPANFPLNKPYLTTNHKRNAEALVKSFNLNYFSASNADELEESLKYVYKYNGKATVLEVFTDPETNARVFKNYIQYLKSNSNE